MPVSSSDGRNKWKKRKRDTQITASRKPKSQPHDDDDLLEEDDDDDLDLDHNQPEFDDDPRNSSDPPSAETEVLLDVGVRLSNFPSVVRHTVNRPHSSVLAIVSVERATQRGETVSSSGQLHQYCMSLENISFGQLQSLSAVPADSPVLTGGDDGSSAYVITPEPIRKGNGVVKQWETNCTHVLPMHSDWFSPSSIDRIERQVVPQFFLGKSADNTPKKYLECRNIIVAKYLENPEKRLSVSDCHGLIVGIDNDDITQIFRFLDNWGIINYCAPPLIHENKNDGLSEDAKGELCVPATALKAIDSLIQFDKPKCMLKAADVYPELVSRGHQTSDLDSIIRIALNEICCNHCSRLLAAVYYRSQKEIDAQLCLECFNEGRFVIGHSSLDFVKFDATKNYGDQDGESWTDQQTLSLLEGIEIYNNNWNQIAELVGNKTKAQCIAHFMCLGADEGLFDNIRIPSPSRTMSPNLVNGDDCGRSQSKMNGESAGSSLEIHDSETKIPFAKSGNPVMSQVAFLASAVGPRVAAACAHASLATLSIGDRAADLGKLGMINGSASDNRMNSESRNAKERGPSAEELGPQGPTSQDDVDGSPLSSERVQKAARAGLSAAAMKAKLFADYEEREIQRLSANIINHQLKRLELKLKQFAEVETLLMKECEQVERARQRIAAERALMMSSPQFGPGGMSRPLGLPAIGPAVSSSRQQQVVSNSASQPFMGGGYSNNQPIHPHMSHHHHHQQQQQQPMYGHGLGPRLPLTAINPSSSGATHPMTRTVSGTTRSVFD